MVSDMHMQYSFKEGPHTKGSYAWIPPEDKQEQKEGAEEKAMLEI